MHQSSPQGSNLGVSAQQGQQLSYFTPSCLPQIAFETALSLTLREHYCLTEKRRPLRMTSLETNTGAGEKSHRDVSGAIKQVLFRASTPALPMQ